MRETFQNDFLRCVQAAGHEGYEQLIKNPPALYVAVPEVKKYIGDYRNPAEKPFAFEERIPPHMRAINMTGIAVY